jgi:hypothetical protein
MIDGGSKGGARLLKKVKNLDEGVVHDIALQNVLQNIFLWECENWHFLYKNNYVAIGVVRIVIV